MKNNLVRLFLFLALILPGTLSAQDGGGDFFHSIGKIYVVVAVILCMFAGILLYLIRLDRKISQLEKRIDNEQ